MEHLVYMCAVQPCSPSHQRSRLFQEKASWLPTVSSTMGACAAAPHPPPLLSGDKLYCSWAGPQRSQSYFSLASVVCAPFQRRIKIRSKKKQETFFFLVTCFPIVKNLLVYVIIPPWRKNLVSHANFMIFQVNQTQTCFGLLIHPNRDVEGNPYFVWGVGLRCSVLASAIHGTC